MRVGFSTNCVGVKVSPNNVMLTLCKIMLCMFIGCVGVKLSPNNVMCKLCNIMLCNCVGCIGVNWFQIMLCVDHVRLCYVWVKAV